MRKVKNYTTTLIAAVALLVTGSPAQASFPGQNGKIVFVGNQSGTWQLYTIEGDGTGITQVTSLSSTQFVLWLPIFSPDGRRILFAHDTAVNPCSPGVFPPSCQVDLYVINADGSGLIRLTDDGLSLFGKWSPDGASITFARASPLTNQWVIATMRAEKDAKASALTSEFWLSFLPVYTSDQRKLVFGSQLGGLVSAAWIMNTDGSNQSRLTPAALEAGPSDVSPDGEHMLLVSHTNTGNPTAIYVMKLDGSDLRQLTRPGGSSSDAIPGYSPDGKKIVFVSNRLNSNNSLDLFTMNADGSNIFRIASGLTVGGCPDLQNCVGPSWGPKPKQ
jgi:Tol biopolymer transport system component